MKWYGKHEGVLDITPSALPDFYLVLSRPQAAGSSSRSGVSPLCRIGHPFDATVLVATLSQIGLKMGSPNPRVPNELAVSDYRPILLFYPSLISTHVD